MHIVIIGSGRAGTSFATAFRRVSFTTTLLHHDQVDLIGDDVDVVMLCVPDDALASVASQVPVSDHRVVVHVAGSRTLEELAPHPRVASMHPLTTLLADGLGADRLAGAVYCVAGDALVDELVAAVGGVARRLDDAQRSRYHATATVAANHLVALLAHVESLAVSAGLTLEDFLPLARQALEDVATYGPHAALTGPASRGDMVTIDAHLQAIPESERATYVALANAAFELAELRRTEMLT
jgi:predicted short-subunit dehydrogenase-like oxidoreductase (DUF2520 family)